MKDTPPGSVASFSRTLSPHYTVYQIKQRNSRNQSQKKEHLFCWLLIKGRWLKKKKKGRWLEIFLLRDECQCTINLNKLLSTCNLQSTELIFEWGTNV